LCFKTFPFLFFKLNLQSNSEVYFLHWNLFPFDFSYLWVSILINYFPWKI
jgi:hypothetical protein